MATAKMEAAARAAADAAAAQAAAAEEETRLETSRRRLETSLALREETKRRNGALARWQVERAARAIGARHRGLASPCRPTPPCLGVRSSGGRGRGRGGAARAAGAAGGLCGVAGWPACACQRAHAAPALSTPSSGPLSHSHSLSLSLSLSWPGQERSVCQGELEGHLRDVHAPAACRIVGPGWPGPAARVMWPVCEGSRGLSPGLCSGRRGGGGVWLREGAVAEVLPRSDGATPAAVQVQRGLRRQ